jgi:hypothetical protein
MSPASFLLAIRVIILVRLPVVFLSGRQNKK